MTDHCCLVTIGFSDTAAAASVTAVPQSITHPSNAKRLVYCKQEARFHVKTNCHARGTILLRASITNTMEEQLSAEINTLISPLISIDHPSSSHLASLISCLCVPKCCPIYPMMLISVNGKEIKGLGCMIPSDRLSKHLDYC